MISLDTIKERTTYKAADEVAEICKPLFKTFNFNYFVYAKTYSDHSTSLLLSDKHWFKHYLANKYPVIGTNKTDGIYTWDKFMPNKALAEGSIHFNHNKGLVVLRKRQNFIEHIEFASPNKDHPTIEICTNKPHLLEKFLFYFKKEASHLIALSEKDRFTIPDAMCCQPFNNKSYEEFCKLVKTNKIHLRFKSENIILTNREYEVLLEFSKGKNTIEVAKTLNVDVKTIDSHLRNAKDKTNCTSKLQLIDIIRDNLIMTSSSN